MRSGRRVGYALVIAVLFTGSIAAQQPAAAGESPELGQIQSLINQGCYAEAETAARALLVETERAAGPESRQTARVLDMLIEALGRRASFGAEALQIAERAVRIRKKRLGPEDPELSTSLRIAEWYGELQRIRSLLEKNQFTEAETGTRALLAQTEAAEGPESLRAARALDLLGQTLARKRAPESETLHVIERVLAIREKLFGPEHPEVAVSLHIIGQSHMRAADYAAAGKVLERAVAIAERAFGPEDLRTARPLSSLAFLRARLGDLGGAEEIHRRVLRIQEKELGAEDLEVATTATGLANVLQDLGKHAESNALYERALTIRVNRLGPTHPDVAATLNNLGVLLRNTGNFAEAKKVYERSLAISEAALGPEHPEVARTLSNLGNMAREAGDFAEARSLLERSVAIAKKALGAAHPDVANTLGHMAQLLLESGDPITAKRLYQESLSIIEKTLGDNPAWRAPRLSGLGYALIETGELEEARKVFEQALEDLQKIYGPDNFFLASGLHDLAVVNLRLRNFGAAQKHAERAVAITEKAMGPVHPNLAEMLTALGAAHTGAGDAIGGKPQLERAVRIFEQVLGREHAALVNPLVQLAETRAALGEDPLAVETALRAESLFREHFLLTGRTLTERLALGLASQKPSGLDLALTLTIVRGTTLSSHRASVWDALVRSRAVVLDEIAARHRTGRGENPQVAELAEALAVAHKRLADAVVRGPGDQESAAYLKLLDELRGEKERVERELAERSTSFRVEQARKQLGVKEAVGALPEDSVLIAFVRYAHLDPAQHKPGEKPRESVPSYAAFVVRTGQAEPALVSLGAAEEIEALVARWRSVLTQEGQAPGRFRRTEAAYRNVGVGLRERIWKPLAQHVAGARRVFVVPDGALHFVNLAALPVGRDRYLIESGPMVHYLSAERDLVPRKPTREGEGLLAVGAPAFDESTLFAALTPRAERLRSTTEAAPADTSSVSTYRGPRSACGSFTSMSFEPLPAAGRETEEIATLWNAAEDLLSAPAPKSRARVLSGAEASEAVVKKLAGGRRILHLATHGFFLGGRCASALASSERQPGAPPPTVVGENPLLLAGLALAGANRRASAGADEEDGILTAEEIAALDLDGVDWAVLSACDTGIGEVQASEGVFGLRRAFQVAGARTVLMSLWPVEDAATRAWMTALYRNRLTRKLSTAEAVHGASLEVLRQRRSQRQSTHPFYWAGFVAVGDWR